jgi:hypothetical protein
MLVDSCCAAPNCRRKRACPLSRQLIRQPQCTHCEMLSSRCAWLHVSSNGAIRLLQPRAHQKEARKDTPQATYALAVRLDEVSLPQHLHIAHTSNQHTHRPPQCEKRQRTSTANRARGTHTHANARPHDMIDTQQTRTRRDRHAATLTKRHRTNASGENDSAASRPSLLCERTNVNAQCDDQADRIVCTAVKTNIVDHKFLLVTFVFFCFHSSVDRVLFANVSGM